MRDLDGHVAIVTGGVSGIGLATVGCLLERGASVVFTDRVISQGKILERQWGSKSRFIQHDVTNADDWRRVTAFACEEFGSVSILVNNAGVSQLLTPLQEHSDDEFHRITQTNQFGVFLGMKAVVSPMRARDGGSIVNVSSMAGIVAVPCMLAYVASKFAVTGMTKAAAIDLGPFKIRVNSVHPGLVLTPMTQAAAAAVQGNAEDWVSHLPIRRLAHPREVADVIAFLASDAASFCTGAQYPVDGGVTAL